MKQNINGEEFSWNQDIVNLWEERILPLFQEGETCSFANYFSPRPFVDEYNRESPYEGFCYTVQPGNRVCIKKWTKT